MSKEEQRQVSNISLNNKQPTELSIDELYCWVIWQFPKKKSGSFCGAVRPALAEHSWLPAFINRSQGKVQVMGHLEEEFQSPEAAVDYLCNHH